MRRLPNSLEAVGVHAGHAILLHVPYMEDRGVRGCEAIGVWVNEEVVIGLVERCV